MGLSSRRRRSSEPPSLRNRPLLATPTLRVPPGRKRPSACRRRSREPPSLRDRPLLTAPTLGVSPVGRGRRRGGAHAAILRRELNPSGESPRRG
eukprot:8436460-Alexandrium_andersonii.AAC.1